MLHVRGNYAFRKVSSLLLVTASATATSTYAQSSLQADQPVIELKLVASGVNQPIAIDNARDGTNRLFIVEKVGRIVILQNGTVLPQPFLDISSIVNSAAYERGLLGLAFHPNYKQNRLFYVYYTAPNGAITISRYQTTADANIADPNSGKVLLTQAHPRGNHNGGPLVFGPDGYLYIGLGDGGGAGDPDRNGQNPKAALGKILRIDVDTEDPYGIPADNPYAQNGEGRPEVWAIGLRNPWRITFDRKTGDLFIADVGQNAYEEINLQKAGAGGANYGWNPTEGFHCFVDGCNVAAYQLPIFEYDHSKGCSITGGYIYRGSAFPALDGIYFYSDYCTGTLWGLKESPDGKWNSMEFLRAVGTVGTFGEDEAGEIYLADTSGGKIYQITHKAS
jgi:glucose/arabinose dehydrogenase